MKYSSEDNRRASLVLRPQKSLFRLLIFAAGSYTVWSSQSVCYVYRIVKKKSRCHKKRFWTNLIKLIVTGQLVAMVIVQEIAEPVIVVCNLSGKSVPILKFLKGL